ncbi:MAG TPA: endonuclease/exonuclease/phosphatase family protein [Caulobacteraceae bacterium]|jgi:endonuclease/exonuclease/phosphatase (EEP) superfamily protein YafD|nr:endonuclease/exonuclease/phosphatase family protein [Caulobacteraceae bacterium]
MHALHVLAEIAAVALSLVSTLLAIAGLGRDGRSDALASFAPFTFLLSLAGAALAWTALGPGLATTALLTLDGVAAVLCLVRLVPEFIRLRPAFRSDPVALRVLSGNLLWINPSGERAVAAILACDPDVVILQEVGRRLTAPLAGLEARYPNAASCPHAGLRIYTKFPMVAHRCNCEQADTPRGRLLTATIRLSDQATVTLATTHFSHPYRGDAQARERQGLGAAVRGLEVRDLVLAGDFNTAPWSHAMRSQDDALAPLRRWSIAWFTWPARLRRGRLAWPLPLLPIDHIYAGPGWSHVRLRRVRLPGSDHFATEASLCRPPVCEPPSPV